MSYMWKCVALATLFTLCELWVPTNNSTIRQEGSGMLGNKLSGASLSLAEPTLGIALGKIEDTLRFNEKDNCYLVTKPLFFKQPLNPLSS